MRTTDLQEKFKLVNMFCESHHCLALKFLVPTPTLLICFTDFIPTVLYSFYFSKQMMLSSCFWICFFFCPDILFPFLLLKTQISYFIIQLRYNLFPKANLVSYKLWYNWSLPLMILLHIIIATWDSHRVL